MNVTVTWHAVHEPHKFAANWQTTHGHLCLESHPTWSAPAPRRPLQRQLMQWRYILIKCVWVKSDRSAGFRFSFVFPRPLPPSPPPRSVDGIRNCLYCDIYTEVWSIWRYIRPPSSSDNPYIPPSSWLWLRDFLVRDGSEKLQLR